jgi:hypothetical protein
LLITPLLAASLASQVRVFKEDPLIFHGDLRVATGNELLRVSEALHSKLCSCLQDSGIVCWFACQPLQSAAAGPA